MTELNSDGTCTVLGQRLTTFEVEKLMRDLARARNHMLPQVPIDLDESVTPIVFQEDPDFIIGLDAERAVQFGLRHRGYGWLVCTFSLELAGHIGAVLAKRAAGEDLHQSIPPHRH